MRREADRKQTDTFIATEDDPDYLHKRFLAFPTFAQ